MLERAAGLVTEMVRATHRTADMQSLLREFEEDRWTSPDRTLQREARRERLSEIRLHAGDTA